jgi:hypothetical protein
MNFQSFTKDTKKGYWDQRILKDILVENDNIVIIPARSHVDKVDEINTYINKLDWCILVLTGDEENVFPIEKIKHPHIKIYQQTPKQKSELVDRYIPNGPSPAIDILGNESQSLRWSFLGQVTHKRRRKISYILETLKDGFLLETEGFTKGLEPSEYIKYVRKSRCTIAPSGPVIPDTFRLYEALESGSLPIVDKSDYWDIVFDEFPIPQIDKPEELPDLINYHNDTYPLKSNECRSWWLRWKLDFQDKVRKDIEELSGVKQQDNLTILIPTSPIPSHPSTDIIMETLKKIRGKFGDRIILMIDGIREEQKDRSEAYNEYIRRLLTICQRDGNAYPMLFKEHTHQVEMTRQALEKVSSKNILFTEHDTPLCEYIPMDKVFELLETENVVRLNHEAYIHPEHEYLYLSRGEFSKTAQWSQRPHFARTDFYKRILHKYFSKEAKCMIEDGIHGHVANDYKLRGLAGWNNWRVWTYTPEGDQKRSYTTDGRKHEPKFDEKFIY